MVTLFVVGWFWNPPVPFPYEDNLAMVDFVRLQQEAAGYLEDHAAGQRIATAWPFSDAISHPDFGYVRRPLNLTVVTGGVRLANLAKLNPKNFDVLVLYSAEWSVKGRLLDYHPIRSLVSAFLDPNVNATNDEIRSTLGFVPALRWTRGGQWIELYLPTLIERGCFAPTAETLRPILPRYLFEQRRERKRFRQESRARRDLFRSRVYPK